MRKHLSAWLVTAAIATAAVVVAAAPQPAIAGTPVTVTADFAANSGTGHAEVFGSAINVLDDTSKMDSLYQSGSRMIRRDAYLSEILPDTTVENYRNNVGGVADPANWDWSKYAWVDQYQMRGFKIILIMSYNASWLGYNCGCGTASPPRAWDVYEDVIKKIYQRFQSKVWLVEIWNEPNHERFLNLTGSPYASLPGTAEDRAIAAYRDIYLHASRAIRSVSTTVPIGGPVVSHPSLTHWATSLLADSRIPSADLNFLSFHHYYEDHVHNGSVTAWKNLAAQAGRGADFPVHITEWNYSGRYHKVPLNNDHPDTVSFTGHRLTDYFTSRANGTAFFADNDDAAFGGDGAPIDDFFGVYANGTLTPKSRTYRLLSTDLGLGAGDSTIRGISYAAPITQAAAATNANGEHMAWVVNDGAEPLEVTLNLTGLGTTTSVTANIFEASANMAVASPRSAVPLTVSGGNASVRFGAPPKSVVGVRLAPYQLADTENLAPGATVTSSSNTTELTLPAANVKDGIVGIGASGEWASNRELTPWVQLAWGTPQTIGRVVLHDRINPYDRVLAGRLTFSDGSEAAVPALPDDGTGKAITFAPRTVSWVRLQVTSGAGFNVGLSEFQAYRGHNVGPEATITSSTQLNTYAAGHFRAADGIAGRNTGEWASTENNPWIKLSWSNARAVSEVILYDRVGSANANSGTLTFSDGTSIAVTGIPADGTPKHVSFPAKSVGWVRFQATGGTGGNVGLSEIRVMQAPNLASSATATASSAASDRLGPAAATDGTVNQWDGGEWASNGQLTPWLQLTWPAPQTVAQVVLYDRNNLVDRATGGTLRFSDGSTLWVPALDDSGLARTIVFQPKQVTWVRFEVASGAGANVGLSELEVFAHHGIQRIESANVAGAFWRHRFGRARIDTAVSPADDARFRIVAGLSDPDGVSFESVNYPGQFLRHQNGWLYLHEFADTGLYRRDATFHQVPALSGQAGYVSYRSANFPTHHVRHDVDGFLRIDPIAGPPATGDASFRAVP